MKTIGVVGRIGAGKSTFRTKLLELYPDIKIRTLDLDIASKELKRSQQSLRFKMQTAFGDTIVDTDPTVVKNFVLNNIFTNDSRYHQLINIFEPYLYHYITSAKRDAKRDGIDLLVIEGAALIHSSLLLTLFDYFVCVEMPLAVCRARVEKRRDQGIVQYTDEQIAVLLHRTTPEIARAWNDSSSSIYFLRWGENITFVINFIISDLKLDTSRVVLEQAADTEQDECVVCDRSVIRTAVYAGSFNPFHIGHLAVIEDLLRTFDKVVLLICINAAKGMGVDRRPADIREHRIDPDKLPNNCEAQVWSGSMAEYLHQHDDGNLTIARGIRNGTDLDYENGYITHLRGIYKLMYNQELPPVVYIPTRDEYKHISSSSIRAVAPFNKEYAESLIV